MGIWYFVNTERASGNWFVCQYKGTKKSMEKDGFETFKTLDEAIDICIERHENHVQRHQEHIDHLKKIKIKEIPCYGDRC